MFHILTHIIFVFLAPVLLFLWHLYPPLFVCLSSSILYERWLRKKIDSKKNHLYRKEGALGWEVCVVTIAWVRVLLIFRETPWWRSELCDAPVASCHLLKYNTYTYIRTMFPQYIPLIFPRALGCSPHTHFKTTSWLLFKSFPPLNVREDRQDWSEASILSLLHLCRCQSKSSLLELRRCWKGTFDAPVEYFLNLGPELEPRSGVTARAHTHTHQVWIICWGAAWWC